MKEVKSIFASKTFWMNALALILSVAVLVDPQVLSLIGIAPEKQIQVMAAIGALTAILNKILRMITNSAVSVNLTKPEVKE